MDRFAKDERALPQLCLAFGQECHRIAICKEYHQDGGIKTPMRDSEGHRFSQEELKWVPYTTLRLLTYIGDTIYSSIKRGVLCRDPDIFNQRRTDPWSRDLKEGEAVPRAAASWTMFLNMIYQGLVFLRRMTDNKTS